MRDKWTMQRIHFDDDENFFRHRREDGVLLHKKGEEGAKGRR